MRQQIILYSAQMCSDCQKLKKYMDAHGIPYELRDIRERPEYAEEVRANTGKLGVPFLVIDGSWVRGYQMGQPFTEDFAASLFA